MGTRLIDDVCLSSEKKRNRVDYKKLFHGVLKDPKLCRHLLLAPHVAEGISGSSLSFIGYLKKLIMSRETSLQLAAVKGILSALIGCKSNEKSHSLKEEKFILSKLLDNDFVEFMCEALPCPSAPCGDDLIQAIFGCLALLSGEDEFYHHFHAVYALEAVLRNLHLVCETLSVVEKSSIKELQTLSIGLALIAMILEGSVNKSTVLEGGCKSIEGGSILERIFQLITKSLTFENPSIKWKSGLVVRSLLNLWHLGKCFSQQVGKAQGSLSKQKKCSPSLISRGEKIKEVKEICRKMSFYHRGVQMIQTRSTIQQSSICIQDDDDGQDVIDPLNAKEINIIMQMIDITLRELMIFVNNLLKCDIPLDIKLMNQFLLLICQIGKNSLRLLPHKMDANRCQDETPMGNKMQELTNVRGSPLEEIFNAVSEFIGGLCVTHLVEIEYNKSSHKVFKESLTCLELLYQKAKDFCSPLSHKLAAKGYLILLPYLLTFDDRCLTEYTLPDAAVPFLMPLVGFVKDVVKIYRDGANPGDMPSPILKALWFSFATSYLSNECPKDPKIEDATHGLMNCISVYYKKHNGIKDIFTYHPALLLWAFSSPIKNQWLQLRIVLLWLEGCQSSKSSKELEQLIVHNQDALICSLSIAENGQREVMECALRTIWSFLQDAEETRKKEISLSLWEILIYVLKRFNAVENALEKERRALNVACMMQLAQATSLSEPNPSAALRLACLLNSTLGLKCLDKGQSNSKKNFYLLWLSGLQMLQFLLDVSLANEDTRVASSLLSHSGQLKRLEWAAGLCPLVNGNQNGISLQEQENPRCASYFEEDLNTLAFSIMTSLLYVDPYSQSSAESLSVNAWHLLKAMSSNHRDISISSLKLMNSLLKLHIMKTASISGPFIQITDAGMNAFVIAEFIRILYLQIIMFCARVCPDTEEYCWKFLYLALKLPDKNFTKHLSTLPWNIALILSRLAIFNGNQSEQTPNSQDVENVELSESFLHFLHEWLNSQHQLDWKHYRKSFRKIESRSIGSVMFQKVLNAIAKALTSEKCEAILSADGGKTGRGESVVKLLLLITKDEKYLQRELSHSLRKKLCTMSKKSQENNPVSILKHNL